MAGRPFSAPGEGGIDLALILSASNKSKQTGRTALPYLRDGQRRGRTESLSPSFSASICFTGVDRTDPDSVQKEEL